MHPKDRALLETLEKFSPMMREQYRTSALAQQAVDALAHGADVYRILEVALMQNDELTKKLIKSKAREMPLSFKFE